jgi:hypothetical protein
LATYTVKTYERGSPKTSAGLLIDRTTFEAATDDAAKAQALERSCLRQRGHFANLLNEAGEVIWSATRERS